MPLTLPPPPPPCLCSSLGPRHATTLHYRESLVDLLRSLERDDEADALEMA